MLYAILVLGGIGVLLGVILGVVNKKLKVETDPREDEIIGFLYQVLTVGLVVMPVVQLVVPVWQKARLLSKPVQ